MHIFYFSYVNCKSFQNLITKDQFLLILVQLSIKTMVSWYTEFYKIQLEDSIITHNLVKNVFLWNFRCLYSLFFILVGDRSQLKPFKRIGNKSIKTDTIFDLDLSKSMKSFAIHGQFRASNSYRAFLGNSRSWYCFTHV